MISKRRSLIFKRLIASYAVTTAVLTILIGVNSYILFTKTFNNELLRLNSITHNQIKDKIIREVYTDIFNIYTDTISPNKNPNIHFLFKNNLNGNHAKILDTHSILSNTVSVKTSHIKAISIYFKNSNLVLSSSSGMNMIDYNASKNESVKQCNEILAIENKGYMIFEPFDTYCNSMMSFVGIYPLGNNYENSLGFIAIDINSDLLNSILAEYSSSTSEYYIIDQNDNFRFNNLNTTLNPKLVPEIIYKKHSSNLEYIVSDYDDTKLMFTYTYMPELKSTLIGVTSVNSFYQKTIHIRNNLLIICICAILVGLFFSGYFSSTIYNPLNKILMRIRKYMHYGSIDSKNEYIYIDQVFNTLTFKVSELESLFNRNKQLIMSGFIQELLNKTINGMDVFNEKLDFLDIKLIGNTYCVIQFELDDKQHTEKIKECEYITYSIIDNINTVQNKRMIMYAVKTSDYGITIVCNTTEDYMPKAKYHVNKLIHAFENKYYIQIFACMSKFTDNPFLIGECYNEIKMLYPYKFILPDKTILTIDEIPALTNDMDFPSYLLDNFVVELKKCDCDIELISNAVNKVVSECKTGQYSYDNCINCLSFMLYELIDYIKKMDASVGDDEIKKLNSEFKSKRDINSLKQWFMDIIFNFIYKEQSRNFSYIKAVDLIKSICSYIDEHISEDISLFAVSENFGISSSYLSRIFKAETGINYIDYITKKRLEKAVELLTHTDLSIDNIASSVGFNSSSYFIKKFKIEYNTTPLSFRFSNHIIINKDIIED